MQAEKHRRMLSRHAYVHVHICIESIHAPLKSQAWDDSRQQFFVENPTVTGIECVGFESIVMIVRYHSVCLACVCGLRFRRNLRYKVITSTEGWKRMSINHPPVLCTRLCHRDLKFLAVKDTCIVNVYYFVCLLPGVCVCARAR